MVGRMFHRYLQAHGRRASPQPCGTGARRVRALLETVVLPLAITVASVSGADVPPAQVLEVDHLLAYLADSDCAMLRNGKVHSGAEGAEHVRSKYEHFRDEIDSTEAFIEMAATKSLMSGQAYQVHCPGQAPVPSAQWLLEELRRYRASH